MRDKFYHVTVKEQTFLRMKRIEEIIKYHNPQLRLVPLTYDQILWRLQNYFEFENGEKNPGYVLEVIDKKVVVKK